MSIIKKIEQWEKEGIITSDQVTAIKAFEDNTKKPTLIYMILFLSAFCIGVGVISLIASNWKYIPASMKLTIDFALLASVAYSIFFAEKNKKIFMKEAVILLYAILIIATIGLVGQIYHLKSNGYSAALFWSAMVAPMFYITRKSILPFIWFFVFNCAIFAWFVVNYPKAAEYLAMIAKQSDMLLSGYYIVIITLLATFVYDKYKEKISYLTKPIIAWSVISIIIPTVFLEFKSSWLYMYRYNEAMVSPSLISLLMVGLFALIGAAFYLYKNHSSSYIFIAVALLIVFSSLIDASGQSKIVKAMSTFSMLGLLMTYAYKNHSPKLFNFAGGLVAFRIFMVYIQVFGSLLSTGIGLIISGVVLLLIAYTWHKVSIRVKRKLKEKTNEA